ncbi:MAG TPA: ankyrin repeat domain-containing protein [Blastocatellia bacterium]|nr:ankyrin repeat domain-containing protein [Blastocatellia bacterium]
MDKRSFIKWVRSWQWDAVKRALVDDSSLAEFADQSGMTPLHHCARTDGAKTGLNLTDSVKTAEALISYGADPNRVRVIMDEGHPFHATPLWFAVAWGKNPKLARALLDRGAAPDGNAVWAAIWDQDLEMAELLRSRGGNIEVVIDGQTPFLATVKSKRFKLVKWLVAHDADVNFQDKSGYTALHHAIVKNHTQAEIEELLKCGADPQVRANDGSSAASLAMALGKKKLARLFEAEY